MILKEHPHRRLNPLTGEWVLVSPHRTKRPWQGQVEKVPQPAAVHYDPKCYLCPGNERAGGKRNPQYETTFVFDNDFAALYPDAPSFEQSGLFTARSERGICRVVCFSPDHSLTLARMSVEDIGLVVEEWKRQFIELSQVPFLKSVQIFENRGEMMGASNPHPHCQLWASESLPNELAKEMSTQQSYWLNHGRCMLCEYVSVEQKAAERMIFENDHFAVVVPFWAVWPFETIVIPKRHWSAFDELTSDESKGLADALQRLTACYDRVFDTAFPYSMGFHQRPTSEPSSPAFHFHAHFYPPLLRSATVRKFMVGFEMLGTPQRDITPESAAERLRELAHR